MIAYGGLIIALIAWGEVDRDKFAWWAWAAGTIAVVAGLLISMIRDFLAGRMGVGDRVCLDVGRSCAR